MEQLSASILEQALAATAEPLMIVRLDHTDWPVLLANPAFESIGGSDTIGQPFADVIEGLVGRELALEISESVRAQEETSFPVEVNNREFLLSFRPLAVDDGNYVAAYWRSASAASPVSDADTRHALLKAKRQLRDLSRDDAATGLLNARAFREVLEHDWAVAARERATLALVMFTLDEFDAYVEVFGRHASDSCLRRVGQTIRRSLRRASDVVARIDDSRLVVLSHASEQAAVAEFAERIAMAVRELGMHHPRSSLGRFVTVSHEVRAVEAGQGSSAATFLDELLVSDGG